MNTAKSTQDIIQRLSEEASPVQTLSYKRVCIEWVAVVVINMLVVSSMYGLRYDMAERMADPLYILELALNAVLIVLMGAIATSSAYPDRARNVLLRCTMLLGFVGYSALIIYVAFRDVTSLAETWEHLHAGWHCTACIVHFALAPAIYVTWRLRKLASTQPLFTGFSVLLLAGLTGTLGVRLVMPELNSPELFLFHYFPLLLLSAVGLLLGRRLYRW